MTLINCGWFNWIINSCPAVSGAIGDFLLQEDGFLILQENGDKIIVT